MAKKGKRVFKKSSAPKPKSVPKENVVFNMEVQGLIEWYRKFKNYLKGKKDAKS